MADEYIYLCFPFNLEFCKESKTFYVKPSENKNCNLPTLMSVQLNPYKKYISKLPYRSKDFKKLT